MDAEQYVDILRSSLKLSIDDVYPDSHQFMQNNDPKQTSRLAGHFFEDTISTAREHLPRHQIVIPSTSSTR